MRWLLLIDIVSIYSSLRAAFLLGRGSEYMPDEKPYVALYRKWRPQTFSTLVGQDAIARTLSNAITQNRVGHAYLFCGPRGTGKTSTAKIFAKALNCMKGPTIEPCNECESCTRINQGNSVNVTEIDAASSRGVDEIRELRDKIKLAPVKAKYRIYIIDEVHMLTTEAFNALLKTLEEPPSYVVFIMATTEPHKVPPTIQSRCQRFDFRRITVEDIKARLEEVLSSMEITADDEAITLIADQADGGMRDALSILDQCITVSDGKVTTERVRQILGLVGHEWIDGIVEAIADRDTAKVLSIISEVVTEGRDLRQMFVELSEHMRCLMIYQSAGPASGLELYNVPTDVLESERNLFSEDRIIYIIGRIHDAMQELRWSPQPQITAESVLLSLCHDMPPIPERLDQADATLHQAAADDSRMERLEARLEHIEASLASLTANRPDEHHVETASDTAQKTHIEERTPSQRQTETPVYAAYDQVTFSDEGAKLWTAVADAIKAAGKLPLKAIYETSKFYGMSDKQFVISFNSGFMKQRTERDDYREFIEDMLMEYGGKPRRLVCRLDLPAKKQKVNQAPKQRQKNPMDDLPPLPRREDVDMDQLPEADREVLQAAVDTFGDHFVNIEDVDMIEDMGKDDGNHEDE